MVPVVGRNRPARREASVDLPEPDRPTTATKRPLGIEMVTSRMARGAVAEYRNESSEMSMAPERRSAERLDRALLLAWRLEDVQHAQDVRADQDDPEEGLDEPGNWRHQRGEQCDANEHLAQRQMTAVDAGHAEGQRHEC